jgi:AraC-like DNA-binding protein
MEQSNNKSIPPFDQLKEQVIISSRTSKQYLPSFTEPTALALSNLSYVSLFGRVHAVFPYTYELRASHSYLLLYTISGQGKLTDGVSSTTLSAGSVLFFYCGINHRIELSEANEWNYIYFNLNGAGVSSYYDAFTSIATSVVCTLSSISPIPSFIEKLGEALEQKGSHQDFIIHEQIVSLLTALLSEQERRINSAPIPPYLSEVKESFDTQYGDFFSLDILARRHHVSKYKLVRDFTCHLGTPPINYLISVRIEQAKRLLATTNDPINEIASYVGIDNMNHFIYLFKKSVGMTPGAYRKTCYTVK